MMKMKGKEGSNPQAMQGIGVHRLRIFSFNGCLLILPMLVYCGDQAQIKVEVGVGKGRRRSISGILLRGLADATHGHRFLSVHQLIYNTIGFCIALAATLALTVYAKRALQNLQPEEQLQWVEKLQRQLPWRSI